MTVVNIAGSKLMARAQMVVVYVMLAILVTFAAVLLANVDRSMLASAAYPPVRDIIASVALRRHRANSRRATSVGSGRLHAYECYRAVRHCWSDQRRPAPGRRAM
jgi:amino acid transporter